MRPKKFSRLTFPVGLLSVVTVRHPCARRDCHAPKTPP